MKRLFATFILFVLSPLGSLAARAENFRDPVPPMSWEQMQGCELVVAAHYQSHNTGTDLRDDQVVKSGITQDRKQTLTLSIDRVLRGPHVKPGALITVELRHLYTVETYPLDDSWRQAQPADGIPRLCYKWQPSNPGGLVPHQIVPNVRLDVLYFFPKASAPFLEQRGQVQSLDFEKDWRAALQGSVPSLGFRATQNFSQKLRESALAEIDETRDPATLDSLFNWLSAPTDRSPLSFSSQQALLTIADHKGDIYNRARKGFFKSVENWSAYDKLTRVQQEQYRRDQMNNQGAAGRALLAQKCAAIMAKTDGERAAREFVRLIAEKKTPISSFAQDQLGSTDSEYALDSVLKWLEQPETMRQGAEIIRKLLIPGYRQELVYRGSTPQTIHLTTLTKERLKKVLQLPIYQASYAEPIPTNGPASGMPGRQQTPLETLRDILGAFLPAEEPPAVSLSHAEQVLLHPTIDSKQLISSPFDSQWTPLEKEGVALLVAIDHERDPRFVPLLVTLMHDASPWLKSQEGYRAISRYWRMFPHAFKAELDKQGLTAPILTKSLEYGFPGAPGRLLNVPNAIWSLSRNDNLGFFQGSPDVDEAFLVKRYASSPDLRRVLADYCVSTLSLDYTGPDVNALHLLWLVDPGAARPLIERVRVQQELKMATEKADQLANPGKLPPERAFAASQSRYRFLALAVTAGHAELVDELLSHFPVPSRELQDKQTRYPQWYDVQVLLWPDNPQVLERYLQITDIATAESATDRTQTLFDDLAQFPPEPSVMIRALFERHPREFSDRTLRLLRSPLQAQRSYGNALLESVFGWNMGYDPDALVRENTAKLKSITALLGRFSALPEGPMRGALLQHLGVTLPTDPAKRLVALRQLLSAPNPVVARNALRLLELQTSDYYADYLWNFPAAQQDRLWNALVIDHDLVLRDMPTPLGPDSRPF